MTTEEKAKEIIDRFKSLVWGNTMFTRKQRQKEAALICVGELIDSYSHYKGMYDQEFFDSELSFWQQVKEEIKRLS